MIVPTQVTRPANETITRASRGHRVVGMLTGPTVVAVVAWLLSAPVAFFLPTLQRFDPTRIRSWAMGLTPLFLGVLALVALALWRRTRDFDWLPALAAAGLASWTVFMLRVALAGTPVPPGGLLGDSGRLAAAATRYESSPAIADAWLPGLAAEYPPLFPWLAGRTAALLDMPAWRIVADFEVLFVSLSVLVSFLLWRKLLPGWVAFAASVVVFLPAGNPPKSYQTLTLAIFIPWVLTTFGRPPKGRWHWLASGLLAAVIVVTYYGWMLWGAMGIVALMIWVFRTEENRRAYLAYLAKVVAVAVAVSSWYLVPYVRGLLTQPGQTVGDLNPGLEMVTAMFPFLDGVPFLPLAILQLIGFVGAVWLRRRVWWAPGLLALALSALVFRFVFTAYFVATEHSALAGYTTHLYGAMLSVAGVLTLVHAVPQIVRRFEVPPAREVLVLVVALLVTWCGYNFSRDWLAGTGGRYSDYTELALREPRTDAATLYNTTPYPPSEWFPVEAIQAAVERQYGADAARRVSLSADERLYAYLPWYGYAVNERGAAPARSRMIDRYSEIKKLAATRDPAAFTAASADTAFGRIDVFVLRKGESGWEWSGNTGFGSAIITEVFSPRQFRSSDWVVTDITGSNFVVITRRV